MIFIKNYIDDDKISDLEGVSDAISDTEKVKLIAKATLDKRLNANDFKIYSYLLNFRDYELTQERISDALDLSRSNVNKSIAKLSAFNYIEKYNLNKHKTSTYIIVRYENAGIINYDVFDIIKAVNTVTKVKDRPRMSTLDKDEFSDVLDYIEELSKNIRDKSKYMTIEELENKKMELAKLENKVSDIIYLQEEMDKLDETIFGFGSLDKNMIPNALDNAHKKFILLIAYSKDERIIAFKERYLEAYIKFLCRFTSDLKCEFFFQAYYDTLDLSQFSMDDLMRICKVTHRETPNRKAEFRDKLESSLAELTTIMKSINKFCHEEAIEDNIPFSNEIIRKTFYLDVNKTHFTFDEFALCIIALQKERVFTDCTNMPFERLVQVNSESIFDCIVTLIRYKTKYAEEIMRIKGEV